MTGWPTPNASDSNARGTSQGNRKSPNPPIAALDEQSNWPTPWTTDTQAGRGCVQIGNGLYRPSRALEEGKLVGGANLADAVTEGWPTPRTQDSKHGECTEYELNRDKGKDLLHVRVERESKEDQKMWPTASARDWKDSPGMSKTGVNPDGSTRTREDQLARAVYALGQQGQDNSNSDGNHHGSLDQSHKNWQTFAPGTNCRGETPHRQVVKALVHGEKITTQCLTVDQVFAEEIKGTNKPKQWRTPNAQLIEPKPEGTKLEGRTPQDPQVGLADQVMAESNKQRETWPTPVVTDSIGSGNRNLEGSKAHAGESLTDVVNGGQKARSNKNTGKLNPRWVETLMGVPIGWTMPSCISPVTIEPTNSDSSATG